MVTIQLPDELVKKLQGHGVVNVEAFVATLIRHLNDADIDTTSQQTSDETDVEKRISALQTAFNEFRHGITPEEWEEIAEAMNEEYIESDDTALGDDDLPEAND